MLPSKLGFALGPGDVNGCCLNLVEEGEGDGLAEGFRFSSVSESGSESWGRRKLDLNLESGLDEVTELVRIPP